MCDETDQKDIAKLDIPGSKHANLGLRIRKHQPTEK
jgi:hypothetical protein